MTRFTLVMRSRIALMAFWLALGFVFLGAGQNVFASACFILKQVLQFRDEISCGNSSNSIDVDRMIAGVLGRESQKQSGINLTNDLLNGIHNLASIGFLELGLEFLVCFLALMCRFHAQSRHDIGLNAIEDQVVQFLD